MPNQTRVNSVARREKPPNRSQLSEPQAVLGKLDNNLSRENSAAPSKNELGLQESANRPHEKLHRNRIPEGKCLFPPVEHLSNQRQTTVYFLSVELETGPGRQDVDTHLFTQAC